MSDQPDAETSTWQHTTLTRRHPCTWKDLNPQSQQASGYTPMPETAHQWDQPSTISISEIKDK